MSKEKTLVSSRESIKKKRKKRRRRKKKPNSDHRQSKVEKRCCVREEEGGGRGEKKKPWGERSGGNSVEETGTETETAGYPLSASSIVVTTRKRKLRGSVTVGKVE